VRSLVSSDVSGMVVSSSLGSEWVQNVLSCTDRGLVLGPVAVQVGSPPEAFNIVSLTAIGGSHPLPFLPQGFRRTDPDESQRIEAQTGLLQ
jgi:hypothetical protein